MRVLVVGSGGREHALAWKLKGSPSVSQVYVAPGNAGTALDARNVAIPEGNHRELLAFAQKERIDLVVIGPEAPLVAGLSDLLTHAGINVFGPSKSAAELEGSKVFCKRILAKANIPTAPFQVFERMQEVEQYLAARPGPCVVKVDGLAAGKGVFVCDDDTQAYRISKRILNEQLFGAAGNRIVIEDRLEGSEVSVLCLTDGRSVQILEPCQDHKRAFDNDQGPNTGGMGAYSPASIMTQEQRTFFEERILIPTLHTMETSGRPFRGLLFAGLMLTRKGPMVLEYNVRFGDPECQTLMVRLQDDLGELLMATATGKLSGKPLQWDPRASVCVVMASGGYPDRYQTGLPIRGLNAADRHEDVKVFHAGTKVDSSRLPTDGSGNKYSGIVTNGGRVLSVVALGEDIAQAQSNAYKAVDEIEFTDAHVRRDIARQAL